MCLRVACAGLVALSWLAVSAVSAQESTSTTAAAGPSQVGLTFFGWSDQHVQTDGNGDHLIPAIDAMNRLPGTAYPPAIGGTVDPPAFVFGCGDITEWPTNAAMKTYESLITKRLKFPAYDVIGNHDEGGKSPSDTIKKWLIARHGALTYAFESGGVRFIALYSAYDESLNNPAQPLTDRALEELQQQLAKGSKTQPTIVATHLCLDAMTNKDKLVDVLAPYQVIAVLGGHYHKATVQEYRGLHFVQLPSPAPNGPREFTVIRVTPDRLVAIPYNYQTSAWSTNKAEVLDAKLNAAASR